MFVKKTKRDNGRIYLTIAHGYRVEGKTKMRTVESLGYLDELEKDYEDPIAHFKAICEERNAQAQLERAPQTITIHPAQKIDKRTVNRKNIGCAVVLSYYNTLDIERVLRNNARGHRFGYDPNAIMRLLTVERLFHPSSKRAAYLNKDNYFFRSEFSEDDVYRSLDFFADIKDKIIATINKRIEDSYGRNRDKVFYDVTNHHFEIDEEDEDVLDEVSGNVISQGMRKKGCAKNNSRHPIIQMGLLQDTDAIPITYRTFPGNTNDCVTMLPVLRDLKRDYGLERVIVVADKGLNTSTNIAANTLDKNGFVFSQSIRGTKSPKETRNWVLSKTGYKANKEGSFKIKSRIQDKTLHIENDEGKTVDVDVEVKIVAFWSEKYARRARYKRATAVAKAERLIKDPSFYTKASSKGAAKYVKNIHFDKDTGEVLEDTGKVATLDKARIAEEEKCDGYYCIITSEIHLRDEEIVDIYKGLWRIEEAFKITKSDLQTRPVYVWTDKHIEAHFLSCYIALTLARLIQKDTGFAYSVAEIMDELSAMSGTHEQDNWWLFDHRSDLSDELCSRVGIDLTRKRMQLSELKSILTQVKHK